MSGRRQREGTNNHRAIIGDLPAEKIALITHGAEVRIRAVSLEQRIGRDR